MFSIRMSALESDIDIRQQRLELFGMFSPLNIILVELVELPDGQGSLDFRQLIVESYAIVIISI